MASIAEKLAASKGAPKKQGKPEPLFAVWQKIRAEQTGEFQSPMTQKDKGQMKKFGEFCPEGKAEQIMVYLLQEWALFVGHVKSAVGLKTVPAQPHVGFTLKHVNLAVQFYEWAKAKPDTTTYYGEHQATVVLNEPVFVQLPLPKAKKVKGMTPEELAAILSEDEPE